MNATEPPSPLRLTQLSTGEPTPFRLEPDAGMRAELASALNLLALKKLRLEGQLVPEGQRNWRLEATLGATVVQPCSVTLAPVTTRIDVPVLRRYLADYAAPDETESEMPEDDSIEPLPEHLDLMQLASEALALALPDFPRAEGAELGEASFAEPGVAPLQDSDLKPFAGLAALKSRMDE